MKQKEMPKAGDVIVLEKSRHNPDLPWKCKFPAFHTGGYGRECYCKNNEHYTVKFIVEEVIWYADNSIEAHGHLEDGSRYYMMLDGPHGDACY